MADAEVFVLNVPMNGSNWECLRIAVTARSFSLSRAMNDSYTATTSERPAAAFGRERRGTTRFGQPKPNFYPGDSVDLTLERQTTDNMPTVVAIVKHTGS
ncbi:MAG TPA: hypothetical protein VHW25_04515 [Steroidobacteraceae bacterium]|nr:hypothetical protein [Steroidobacteraceae bacterium]